MRKCIAAVFLLALAFSASAQTPTDTYTGAPFTTATPPYTVGGNVTGTFTTASPLPPFLAYADIRPSLESLSFSDGVATRTLANSFICTFLVATDGVGNITGWIILLRQSPYAPATPQHSIDSSGVPGGIDLAGTGPANASPCGFIALTTSGSSNTRGSWTDTYNAPSQPTTYTYTGAPYGLANPPYTSGDNLTGTITTANPLPPFLPLTDIVPFLTSLSFDDGVQVRTLASSAICGVQVATDGAGNITRWQISLRELPYTTGSPQGAIDSTGPRIVPGALAGSDLVGSGLAGPGPCDPMVLTNNAQSNAAGTWTDTNPLASQPTTYTYTGDLYTTATAPYTTSDRVTGTITTANPLPPFLPLTDISAAVASLSFNDGVQTRTFANSFLCSVSVATDGAGNITAWDIRLRESPSLPATPQHSIDSSGTPSGPEGIDLAGTGPADANVCGPVILNPSASAGSQGTWTDTNPLASQPATYTYTGAPFTFALPPWTTGQRVTGTITTANPLPPFLPFGDIKPALVSLTFTDGIQTRTLNNSFICSFNVATDGAGNITRWEVLLRESPYTTGNPQQSIDSNGNVTPPFGIDLAGVGLAAASPCGPIVLTAYGSSQAQGTWIGGDATIGHIPALDARGLAMLMVLLAGAALLVMRIRA
jgi:hypothetical protein